MTEQQTVEHLTGMKPVECKCQTCVPFTILTSNQPKVKWPTVKKLKWNRVSFLLRGLLLFHGAATETRIQ